MLLLNYPYAIGRFKLTFIINIGFYIFLIIIHYKLINKNHSKNMKFDMVVKYTNIHYYLNINNKNKFYFDYRILNRVYIMIDYVD